MLEELLPYYEQELTTLRLLGKEFARKYPKVAGQLLLRDDRCDDPHVERLIEAFAFLAARIHRKLDDELPHITEALLGVLYPHYLQPFPSLSIASFEFREEVSQLTGKLDIARHSTLNSHPIAGQQCKFRTAYPLEIWPVGVKSVSIQAVSDTNKLQVSSNVNAVLKIRLMSRNPQSDFASLGVTRLRFYLNLEMALAAHLYELLFNQCERVAWLKDDSWTRLGHAGPDAIQTVGFHETESLLDYDARSFTGYRLLTEFFAFPEKFLFFELSQFPDCSDSAQGLQEMEVALYLRNLPSDEITNRLIQSLSAESLKLYCTPVVNLFEHMADPILLTHTQTEYLVQADARRPLSIEVHTVKRVARVQKQDNKEQVTYFKPFYSVQHGLRHTEQETYWYTRRVSSLRAGDAGTNVMIALVDTNFQPQAATQEAISLQLSCTNRDLPTLMHIGHAEGDFLAEAGSSAFKIRALIKPTTPIRPDNGKGAQWKLISHLTLNHLSLVEGGADALVEMLTLYNYKTSTAQQKLIDGIRALYCTTGYAMLSDGAFPVALRGTDLELRLDESCYIGSNAFLFSRVLDHFLGLYCAPNSFTRLKVMIDQNNRELVQWPARSGTAPLV